MIQLRLSTTEQAHAAIARIAWPAIKSALQSGREQLLVVSEWEDHLSVKQRGYYHKVILTEIAKQVSHEGVRHPMATWKEFIRAKFLGSKRVTFINPLTGRKSRRSVRVSTESLGVRRYNKLIELVTAYAVTELDVRFPVGSWETWEDPDGE